MFGKFDIHLVCATKSSAPKRKRETREKNQSFHQILPNARSENSILETKLHKKITFYEFRPKKEEDIPMKNYGKINFSI